MIILLLIVVFKWYLGGQRRAFLFGDIIFLFITATFIFVFIIILVVMVDVLCKVLIEIESFPFRVLRLSVVRSAEKGCRGEHVLVLTGAIVT